MVAIDVMTLVRDRLGDIKKQRWSDARLLTIVSQGQIDICLETGYLRKEVLLVKSIGNYKYQLPSDCFEVKRVEEYDGTLVPFNSRDTLDKPTTSLSDSIAYKSNLNVRKLEIKPAPLELDSSLAVMQGLKNIYDFQVTPLVGTVTSTDEASVTVEPLYGVVTGIDSKAEDALPSTGRGEIQGLLTAPVDVSYPNSSYGVLVSVDVVPSTDKYGVIVSVDNHITNGKYGIVANIVNKVDTYKVYYVATPRKLTSVTDVLLLPELWEDLLMKYVVGTALQDDNDSNNIQRGEYELNKYIAKLNLLKDQSAEDFSSSASGKNETNFRRV